jgi:type IX secretion system PorP/SprF family membrane protein
MIRLVTILIIMVSCLKVVAQQDPLISHLFFNKLYVNPAFAGQQDEICTNIINRQQWVGLEGAPKSTLFTLDAPLSIMGIKSGIGLELINETLGFEKNFSGSLQYSYIRNLRSGSLSFGLKIGLYNKAYDATWQTPDGGNGQDDVAIPQPKDQSMTYDLGFGALYVLDNFYVGFSAAHLTQPKFKFATSDIPFLKRHYYLISGYKLIIPNSPIELTPNVLVAYDGGSPQLTMNINALYNKKFWGGVTYRTLDALDINVGIELFNGIKIGYAYGLNLSKLIKTNGGSHEFMIGYCFNLGIGGVPQKYRSVRFL